MKGIIEEKKNLKSSKTGKPFWVYTILGVEYSTANPKHSSFSIGQELDFEVEKNGKYNNIKSVVRVGDPAKNGIIPAFMGNDEEKPNTKKLEQALSEPTKMEFDMMKHTEIRREACLNSAIASCGTGVNTITKDKIIDVAIYFEQYIITGECPSDE